MGDIHDAVARIRPRFKEVDNEIYQKRLSNVQSIRGPEFYKALELIRKDKLDSFFKLLDEEMDSQWDRIIDRRFFNIVSNLSFVALGFILGRL